LGRAAAKLFASKSASRTGWDEDGFLYLFDTGHHPAYDALVNKVMDIVTDPKRMSTHSSPEQIAKVAYEAATDRMRQQARH
jgi:hypothetical protein